MISKYKTPPPKKTLLLQMVREGRLTVVESYFTESQSSKVIPVITDLVVYWPRVAFKRTANVMTTWAQVS